MRAEQILLLSTLFFTSCLASEGRAHSLPASHEGGSLAHNIDITTRSKRQVTVHDSTTNGLNYDKSGEEDPYDGSIASIYQDALSSSDADFNAISKRDDRGEPVGDDTQKKPSSSSGNLQGRAGGTPVTGGNIIRQVFHVRMLGLVRRIVVRAIRRTEVDPNDPSQAFDRRGMTDLLTQNIAQANTELDGGGGRFLGIRRTVNTANRRGWNFQVTPAQSKVVPLMVLKDFAGFMNLHSVYANFGEFDARFYDETGLDYGDGQYIPPTESGTLLGEMHLTHNVQSPAPPSPDPQRNVGRTIPPLPNVCIIEELK